jgi:nucleoside transporter
MAFSGFQAGLVYMTMAIASILAPLIAGQLADRYFPTQNYLAISHLLGAGVLYLLTQVPATADWSLLGWNGSFWSFFGLMMLYQLLYAPTVALTNSLAFHHLPAGEKQFSPIRLWGAVSWILVGVAFGAWLKMHDDLPKEEQLILVGQCLVWAGYFSVIMAGYCMTLPHTPPAREAPNPFAFMEALKLLKEPSFAVLCGVSFLVATELQFYYVFGGPFFGSLPGVEEGDIPQILTIGQIVEVFVLLGLPWFVARFGIRTTIVVGILAWPIRYGIFALGEPVWLVIASQGLHGLAYGFFFVGGQIYADRVAGKDIRASAQSFMVLVTAGIGMLLSSLIAGPVVDAFTLTAAAGGRPAEIDWRGVFLVPVAITVVGAGLFVLGFREKTKEQLDREFGRAEGTPPDSQPAAAPAAAD